MSQPIVSPDGRFWWNGQQWVALPPQPTGSGIQLPQPTPIPAHPKQSGPNRVMWMALGGFALVLVLIMAAAFVDKERGTVGAPGPHYTVDGDDPLHNVDSRVRAAGAPWLGDITGVEQGSWLEFYDIYVTTDLLEGGDGAQATSLAICQAYANASAGGTRIIIQGYTLKSKTQVDGSTASEKKLANLAVQHHDGGCGEY